MARRHCPRAKTQCNPLRAEISKNRAICARCGGRNGHSSCVLINGMTCTTACRCSFCSSAMLAVLTSCEMEVLLLRKALHVSRIDSPGPDRPARHQRGEARDLMSRTRIRRVYHSSDPSARPRWSLGDPRTLTGRR